MTAAPLDPADLARIRRNAETRLRARAAGWEVSLVERDRDQLLAEVDRLAADLAAEQGHDLKEVRAEAAELMADECHDFTTELMIKVLDANDPWTAANDALKDYMHDWAQKFRAGEGA